MITAEEAQRIGLVNRIYEPAELLPAAEAMAKKIIANAPLAVKYTMEAIERGVEMPQEEGLFLEATLFGLSCATEDMREGTKAFLEKRAAQFKGDNRRNATHDMTEKLQPGKIIGELSAAGLRFGIVVSRFNSFITERLLSAAVDALERAGAANKDVDVVHVPGAFELPLAAKKLAATGRYDALIAIGCVLRGETTHYDYVCSETARGLQLAQMDSGLPIIFCVLTCDTLEQAIDRAGLKGGNKGFEAGLGAIEMARLSRKLRPAKTAPEAAGKPRRK